ncbi:hypothetical protein CLOM_g7837 [Closterium sp. NIES-68]|nr:hypothetical protein CLOM_g7837 [Closterium sp. NIES-68]
MLGAGHIGVVRRCIENATKQAFACKSIDKNRLTTSAARDEVRREVAAMQSVAGHPGVVQLRAVFEDERQVHLVMDLCDGGELFDEIVRRQRLPERDAALFFRQIASAVAFCHSKGVMHRDLKPENILLASPPSARVPSVKLADFGFSIPIPSGHRACGVAGSPFYMAPEVLSGEYGAEADVWSLGVVLYVLLSGTPPFWGADDNAVFRAVLDAPLDLTSGAWAGVSAEAKGCSAACCTATRADDPPPPSCSRTPGSSSTPSAAALCAAPLSQRHQGAWGAMLLFRSPPRRGPAGAGE